MRLPSRPMPFPALRSLAPALAFVVGLVACGGPSGPRLVDWPPEIATDLVLRDVRVVDVEAGVLGERSDVHVRDGRIAAIGAAGSVDVPGARIVEGEGRALVPGLVDMHGHVATSTRPSWELTSGPTPELNMRSYVYSGVTTVFDPGDGSGRAFERRAEVAARDLVGPRIFTVGPILTAPSSHPLAMAEALVPGWLLWFIADDLAWAVEDDEAAKAFVDELAEAGADGIKIVVDRIPLDAMRMEEALARAIVEAAEAHDLRVVAHIGTTDDALVAGRAGVGLWVHGVYKEPIPEATIAELVGFGIPMVTTSEVFDSYGRSRQGPIEATRLERETVPADQLDDYYPLPDDFDLGPLEGWLALMEETREVRLDNVRRLHAAGMRIFAGSDTQSKVFAGPALHRELVTLAEAGLTPAEVLRAATLEPARWLTRSEDPDFGVLGVGKRADLLLVDGDPTRDVRALEALHTVVLDGVVMERESVLEAGRDD